MSPPFHNFDASYVLAFLVAAGLVVWALLTDDRGGRA